MRKLFRGIFYAVFILLILTGTLWASLALWFRLPAPELARYAAAGLIGVLGLFTVYLLFTRNRARGMAIFLLAIVGVWFWWNTIHPPSVRNWSPDVSRQVTGVIEDENLKLDGVRNFVWRSKTDFDEQWETRNYDLSKLETVDLFMSYWAGPEMAHMILSFGFEGGDYLAWSVEVRRVVGGGFSPVADLFKTNTLAIIAADERDLIGLRTNVRGEDVQLFRINTSPEKARALLEKYVEASNRLAARPVFYNSLVTNCTSVVMSMIRTIVDEVPLDWRVVANGYLPDYAHDRNVLVQGMTVAELREAGKIRDRALAAGLTPAFSTAIRDGVPSPFD